MRMAKCDMCSAFDAFPQKSEILTARQFNFHVPGRGGGIRSDKQPECTFVHMEWKTTGQILKHKHFR